MCGIYGEFAIHGQTHAFDISLLRHRGPDSFGIWHSQTRSCVLAHTRLAIQDLTEAGHQPRISTCGRFIIIFNGEIYNHISLRQYLTNHQWDSKCDTETLLELFAVYGTSVLQWMHGMFSFAIYDVTHHSIFLVRDRLGIKPLYITQTDSSLYISSEVRMLPVSLLQDQTVVADVLATGHLNNPSFSLPLAINKVYSLPPGTSLHFSSETQNEHSYYWPKPNTFYPTKLSSRCDAVRQLRSLLDEIVQEHLVSDVPVGCFLSSGVDSGILVSLANRLTSTPVSSFTLSFPNYCSDESLNAKEMADYCGSDHHLLTLDDDMAHHLVLTALSSLDIPTADALNTFLVSHSVASQGIRVALSGLGADELFGGYPSHRITPLLIHLKHIPSRFRNRIIKFLFPRLSAKLDSLHDWNAWDLTLALRRWRTSSDLQTAGTTNSTIPPPPNYLGSSLWSDISWAELIGYTEPMLLRDSDVMSMAASLELRVPFLDHRLVEFALTIPHQYHRPGKKLLKDATSDLFPVGYLRRPKQGFSLPMDQWIRGPLFHESRLRILQLVDSRLLDRSWIEDQWNAYITDHINWTRIWTLVVLGEFVGREAKTE